MTRSPPRTRPTRWPRSSATPAPATPHRSRPPSAWRAPPTARVTRRPACSPPRASTASWSVSASRSASAPSDRPSAESYAFFLQISPSPTGAGRAGPASHRSVREEVANANRAAALQVTEERLPDGVNLRRVFRAHRPVDVETALAGRDEAVWRDGEDIIFCWRGRPRPSPLGSASRWPWRPSTGPTSGCSPFVSGTLTRLLSAIGSCQRAPMRRRHLGSSPPAPGGVRLLRLRPSGPPRYGGSCAPSTSRARCSGSAGHFRSTCRPVTTPATGRRSSTQPTAAPAPISSSP